MSTDSTVVQRIELLAGEDAVADLHALSDTLAETSTLTTKQAHAQLLGEQPLTAEFCNTLATHLDLAGLGQWMMDYLTDADLDHGTVAHVRNLARMVAHGHTWRRLRD